MRQFQEFEEFENDGYLTAKRFIFGKEVSGELGFFDREVNRMIDDKNDIWLSTLKKVADKSQNNQVALQWAEQKLKQTR